MNNICVYVQTFIFWPNYCPCLSFCVQSTSYASIVNWFREHRDTCGWNVVLFFTCFLFWVVQFEVAEVWDLSVPVGCRVFGFFVLGGLDMNRLHPVSYPALVLFVALALPFPIPSHGALSLAPSPKFACYCLCTIFRKGLAWKFSGLKFLMVWHVLSCSWMLVVSRCWGFWVCFVWSFFWYWGSDMILLQPLPTHDDYDNEALG